MQDAARPGAGAIRVHALAHHRGRGVAAHRREPARPCLLRAAPRSRRPPAPAKGSRRRRAGSIHFEGGRCTEDGPGPRAAGRGVRLLPLELALEEFETPLYRLFKAAVEEADNKLVAWHYGGVEPRGVPLGPGGPGDREAVLHRLRGSRRGGDTHLPPRGGASWARERAPPWRSASTARTASGGILCNAGVDMRPGGCVRPEDIRGPGAGPQLAVLPKRAGLGGAGRVPAPRRRGVRRETGQNTDGMRAFRTGRGSVS